MNQSADLNGIVSIVDWNHSKAVLNVQETELQRQPNFAPEVVLRDQLVAARSDEEIVEEDSDEEISEQKCECDDEKVNEEAVRMYAIDLDGTREATEQRESLKW